MVRDVTSLKDVTPLFPSIDHGCTDFSLDREHARTRPACIPMSLVEAIDSNSSCYGLNIPVHYLLPVENIFQSKQFEALPASVILESSLKPISTCLSQLSSIILTFVVTSIPVVNLHIIVIKEATHFAVLHSLSRRLWYDEMQNWTTKETG